MHIGWKNGTCEKMLSRAGQGVSEKTNGKVCQLTVQSEMQHKVEGAIDSVVISFVQRMT